MTDWQNVRFQALLETHRAIHTHLIQFSLGLIIATVTTAGFAIDRESWGLAALGLVFDATLLLSLIRYRTSAARLLNAVQDLEDEAPGPTIATPAIRKSVGLEFGGRSPFLWMATLMTVIHLGLVVFTAVGLDWTFSGGNSDAETEIQQPEGS